MSLSLLPLLSLWAQDPAAAGGAAANAANAAASTPAPPQLAPWLMSLLQWLYIWGEPTITEGAWYGAVITFVKVVGLFCLLGWVFSWVIAANKERIIVKAKTDWLDIAALVGLIGIFASFLVGVLQTSGRISPAAVAGMPLASFLGIIFGLVLFVWVERALWTTMGTLGTVADRLVLGGLHVALGVGFALAAANQAFGMETVRDWRAIFVLGCRWGATYMGLVVLARVAWMVLFEILAIRARRLYAIARLAVVESTRRMWAPWAVLIIFGVILAFTHWFLQAPDQRPAELGRLYIGSLSLLISLLMTFMIAILSPISLPQDIKSQTIYTVVSKPVRRLELIWGRMLGFMAIVTALMIIFGVFSLGYLRRQVLGTIEETEAQALALREKDPARSKLLTDQAEQLRTRMSARVPVKGSLTFLDSRGKAQVLGIDVGQDSETANFETRSFVEGATPATAIWQYGVVPDPIDPRLTLDRRIPVDQFLTAGTIEAIENEVWIRKYAVDQYEMEAAKALDISQEQYLRMKAAAGDANEFALVRDLMKRLSGKSGNAGALASGAGKMEEMIQEMVRLREESRKLSEQAASLDRKADAAEKAGNANEADSLRRDAAKLHSPPIQLEMTFTVYRTTKGRIGEPVYAQLEVTNPRTNQPPFRNIFPIREYYTNKQFVPAAYLVGSLGSLKCEVRCISPTQYLGMAESDFYILQQKGNFGLNFWLGLFGIWLQAMVLTAVGVFAGTFLSWPVALLTTVFFFIAGQVAFVFLQEFALQSLIGGGPAESLIRLLTHDNQMSDLTPTLGVIVAKTFDAMVMPVMGRLVYLVPNFSALDVTNTVADGFAVKWETVFDHVLLALGYAIPFSIGGYFILKNREVAA